MNASWPAPQCVHMSTTNPDAYYKLSAGADLRAKQRNTLTGRLLEARAARLHPTCTMKPLKTPAMYPDEFELLVKTMVQARPHTYVEWGAGQSTSWYPRLARRSFVIDNYPPWCAKVAEDPTVKCLMAQGRLKFRCALANHADGSPTKAVSWGRPQSSHDAHVMAPAYLNAFDSLAAEEEGEFVVDAALVDGRFRALAALKLLRHLRDRSVVFMHDFWHRPIYLQTIKPFYNVIGRSRSAVVLMRKRPAELPPQWEHTLRDTIEHHVRNLSRAMWE